MYTSNDFKALEAVVLDYVDRYGLSDKADKYFRASRQRERVLSRAQLEARKRPPLFTSARTEPQQTPQTDVLVLTKDMMRGTVG